MGAMESKAADALRQRAMESSSGAMDYSAADALSRGLAAAVAPPPADAGDACAPPSQLSSALMVLSVPLQQVVQQVVQHVVPWENEEKCVLVTRQAWVSRLLKLLPLLPLQLPCMLVLHPLHDGP